MNFIPTKKSSLVLGGEPRVDLLPPEVRQNERAAATRKLFGIMIVVAVVVMAAGTGLGVLRTMDADSGLAAEQATAAAKALEKTKYLEATTLNSLVAATKEARTVGTSTEVLWANLYNQIAVSLPSGVSIVSTTMTGTAPWAQSTPIGGIMRGDRVAGVALVVASASVIDQTALVRSFAAIPGYANASISSVVQAKDVYSMTISLDLSKAALSGRFPLETAKVSK